MLPWKRCLNHAQCNSQNNSSTDPDQYTLYSGHSNRYFILACTLTISLEGTLFGMTRALGLQDMSRSCHHSCASLPCRRIDYDSSRSFCIAIFCHYSDVESWSVFPRQTQDSVLQSRLHEAFQPCKRSFLDMETSFQRRHNLCRSSLPQDVGRIAVDYE